VNAKKRVWWTQPIEDFRDEGRAILERGNCEIFWGETGMERASPYTEDALIRDGQDADAILVGGRERLSKKVLESLNQLAVVVKAGVGVDNIDVKAATTLGVLVANSPVTPDYVGVAEGAVARMLSLAKRLSASDHAVKSGAWGKNHGELMTTFVANGITTVGLVGLGRIGSYVASLLLPWRVRILAYDPYVTRDKAFLSKVELVDFDTLLRESDFLSIHAVLTPETMLMINERALQKMKKTAYIINTSRGAIIDEKALCNHLREGLLAGAALDVFEEEPPTGEIISPELSGKVLLSPHTSALSAETERETTISMANSCLSALAGIAPETTLNQDVLPKWKELHFK
jgi:D-3-phosphoglycerate dehydrogenase / 2-oxoglutarate reductase